jgi:hypothetical protein
MLKLQATRRHSVYEGFCRAFAKGNRSARARTEPRRSLQSDLDISGISLDASTVTRAANRAALMSASILLSISAVAWLTDFNGLVLPGVAVAFAGGFLVRELTLGHPSSAAKRQAEQVLKDSTRATNLMIMSLGHEPSISKAIAFAARDNGPFSEELRRCIWSVVMGRCESFEEALHALGSRWSRFSGELKATLNSMVTASCESTESGRRRALDRANSAMITGAKRRIEEYALSLSTPSMVLFGLGILLPLMVGSFLPMLSWNLWSLEGIEEGAIEGPGDGGILQTMFLMNILFPAMAYMVASNAVSHHPLETQGSSGVDRINPVALIGTAFASIGCSCAALSMLDGFPRSACLLLSATVPFSALFVYLGIAGWAGKSREAPETEDALFLTGARMLEGENFEAALDRAASDLDEGSAKTLRSLSFRSNIVGQDLGSAISDESARTGRSNALEALNVVKEAAAKDESDAGLLAMDLAAYLKDLHDLEHTLRGRLRPTISMMKMTAYALGPIVMGVTYAIYVSMGSIAGSQGGLDPNSFVLVLGAFLAETGAIVSYFVWGIEGRGARADLMFSVGTCVISSELIFAATAVLASR